MQNPKYIFGKNRAKINYNYILKIKIMSNFSEVGHTKNVANFEDLISRCTGFGVVYNPSLNAIKIANMNTLRTNALAALASVISTHTAYMNAVDAREIIFEPLQKFATRIMSALKACGASDAVIKDATTIHRKIQGKRAKPIKEVPIQQAMVIDPNNPTPVEPVHISVSQLSYDSIVDHYSILIDLLTSVVAYTPNENELKIAGLNTLLTSMKTANTAVITATTNFNNARINRNDILYKKDTGLVDVAQECKNYVKSVFGSTHAKYKEVSGIKFTKRRGS
jgi:hypothetical protein